MNGLMASSFFVLKVVAWLFFDCLLVFCHRNPCLTILVRSGVKRFAVFRSSHFADMSYCTCAAF